MSKLDIVTKDTKVIGVNATENPKVYDLPANPARVKAQMEEPNTVEITSNKKSGTTSSDYEMHYNGGLGDERVGQSSEIQCLYHFGYLSEKDKCEVIPETCFACPKSVECMLSQLYKSPESVKEIKKWYSPR